MFKTISSGENCKPQSLTGVIKKSPMFFKNSIVIPIFGRKQGGDKAYLKREAAGETVISGPFVKDG